MRVGRCVTMAMATLLSPLCRLCAQDSVPPHLAPVSNRGRLPRAGCAGQKITDIVVVTQPPYTDKLPRQAEFLRRAARSLHVTTRVDVIRRFLLLDVGEPCNQIRRAESERILRAQPYLVDARIDVYDDEQGGVRLEVQTRDEFSLIAEPNVQFTSPVLKGMRLGESNLGGTAVMAAVNWRDGGPYNDVIGAQLTDYQFGGARNELRLLGQRYEHGQELRAEVIRPYYTDLQRFAWVASLGGTRDYVGFLRPGRDANAVNVVRQFADVGAVSRLGPIGRLKLLGLSLTREYVRTDSLPVLLTDMGIRSDSAGVLPVRFRQQRVVRLNGLLGLRRLRFERVQGFDALDGAQDIRVGMQMNAVYGQSLGAGNAIDRDRFVATNLYAGLGGARWFSGIQAIGEARYNRNRKAWENLISSGRVAWYFKPAVKQLTLVQAEWGAARNMQVPFQLSLADYDGGILGHGYSDEPGAKRLVFRAEQRLIVPTRYNVADVGFAGFAEMGKLWAERSVPYSVTTPWRGAVGVSILAAIPPHSRRLWRVDFALPISSDPQRRFEIRFSNDDRTRVFWREPADVSSFRERTVPTSLFSWP